MTVPRGISEAVAARWSEAQEQHAPCVICGRPVRKIRKDEPLCRYIERATCSPACRKEHHRAMSQHNGATGVQTPVYRRGELVSVDYAGGFGRQTVRTKATGRLPTVDARSGASVALGWLV